MFVGILYHDTITFIFVNLSLNYPILSLALADWTKNLLCVYQPSPVWKQTAELIVNMSEHV